MPANSGALVNRRSPIYTDGVSDSERQSQLQGYKASDSLHPDGCPWLKCCNIPCAFIRDRRFGGKSRIQDCAEYGGDNSARRCLKGEDRFICVHRSDDGHFRICAGFHAMQFKKDSADVNK